MKVTPFRPTRAERAAAERARESEIANRRMLCAAIGDASAADIAHAVETRQLRDPDFDGVALGDLIGRLCWHHRAEHEHGAIGGEGVS